MSLTLLTHSVCQEHDMGGGHPECPQRLHAITGYLRRTGLATDLRWLTAEPASRAQILAVHPESCIAHVEATIPDNGWAMLDAETALCPMSLEAALHAAGAGCMAVDRVMQQDTKTVFCAVRPPGHHAEQSHTMGFCVFNSIAVAVRHAQQKWGVRRLAVLDFDVHHGNGTVDIFQNDPDVLVCSSFQHPFYPGRYTDIARPNIVNTPLPAGTRGRAFRKAVEKSWLPALESHRPELIFVSAGFDAHREDPLAQLELIDDDFRWISALIVDVASQYSEGRIISMLEGGYHLDALARCVHLHIETLGGL